MAKAGFLPGAPKLSTLADAPLTEAAARPVKAINPAGLIFKLTLACAATKSGGSPCRRRTLEMSTSNFARVLVMSSMSFSANATFSTASSCISSYDADIFVGMDMGVPMLGATEPALDDDAEGESGREVIGFVDEEMVVIGIGVDVEERLEWRM